MSEPSKAPEANKAAADQPQPNKDPGAHPTTPQNIQDKPLDETAKVHKAAADQIKWYQEHNRAERKKAEEAQKADAQKARSGKLGEADKVGQGKPDVNSGPSAAADAGGVGGEATGPGATQAGAAGAAIGAPAI